MTAIETILDQQRAWQALSVDDGPVMRAMVPASLAICSEAIARLSGNLRELGYAWVSSKQPPIHGLEDNIRRIEASTGLSIPSVLVEFWKIVGGISFVDLETYGHVDFWEKHQIIAPRGYADGLHVDACDQEWTDFICQDHEDWKQFQRQDGSEKYLFSLSPDGFHKDNIGGGMPYGVFAGPSWKPIWQNFEWSGTQRPVTSLTDPPDLLSYLRTTLLECAGFPALLGEPAFDSIREKLLEGVPVF